jgi:hypothetical protein
MRFIPFLAFPVREQRAIHRALSEACIARAGVCVSRLELEERHPCGARHALTTISTPHGCRTYGPMDEDGWLAAVQRDPPLGWMRP